MKRNVYTGVYWDHLTKEIETEDTRIIYCNTEINSGDPNVTLNPFSIIVMPQSVSNL